MKKERSKELFSPESCSPVLSGGIRDFTVHGTEPVPLHIYHQDYAHGGLSVPFHWHKELEWIWVEKGTLTLTLKTETRTISEGTFLFINSHELHQLCSIGTTPSVHHALVFLPEILSCAYLDSCEADWIRPLLSHQLLLPAFPLEELSAAEASSQTQKTFVLTLSELFQEILYAYDTKPIGFLHFWRNTSFFFIRNPSALVKKKDLINVKNSYVIFRITMIPKSVFQILLLYSI